METQLKQTIAEDTPFGKPDGGNHRAKSWFDTVLTNTVLTKSQEEQLIEVGDDLPHTEVDPEPLAVAITLARAITEFLDYQRHEALYEVSRTFDVTAYRTFWLGFSDAAESVESSPSVGHRALLTVGWYRGEPVEDSYLRGWFEGTKTVLSEYVDEGRITQEKATTRLLKNLLERWQGTTEPHLNRRD